MMSDDAVEKSGFLVKKAGFSFGIPKWDRRYFNLEDGTLKYFKDDTACEGGAEPRGVVHLENYTVLPAVEKDTKRPNTFLLSCPNVRTYYISAETEEEMQEWMTAIMNASPGSPVDRLCTACGSLHSGYIRKQLPLLRGFKPRYFIITPYFLYMFRPAENKVQDWTLRHSWCVLECCFQRVDSKGVNVMFKLSVPERKPILLLCEDEEVFEKWNTSLVQAQEIISNFSHTDWIKASSFEDPSSNTYYSICTTPSKRTGGSKNDAVKESSVPEAVEVKSEDDSLKSEEGDDMSNSAEKPTEEEVSKDFEEIAITEDEMNSNDETYNRCSRLRAEDNDFVHIFGEEQDDICFPGQAREGPATVVDRRDPPQVEIPTMRDEAKLYAILLKAFHSEYFITCNYLELSLLRQRLSSEFPHLTLPLIPPSRLKHAPKVERDLHDYRFLTSFWKEVLACPSLAQSNIVTDIFELLCTYRAVACGDLDFVKHTEQRGVNLSTFYGNGKSPVHLATQLGLHEILEFLLTHDAGGNIRHQYTGDTPVLYAAKMEDITAMKLLCDKGGADISVASERSTQPIHVACTLGNSEIFSYLISQGANINCSNELGITPLHIAAKRGNLGLMKMLNQENVSVDAVDYKSRTPLHYGAMLPNIEVVSYILDIGADIEMADCNENRAIHYAPIGGDVGLAKFLVTSGASVNVGNVAGDTPLIIMTREGRGEDMFRALQLGKDDNSLALDSQNKNGLSAMHEAVMTPNFPILKLLLEEKADVDLQESIRKFTPLMVACFQGNVEAAELLIEHGSDLNKVNFNGGTCLHIVIQANVEDNMRDELLSLLFDADIPLDVRDGDGCTALHYAIQYGMLNHVKQLVQRGANVSLPNNDGDYAMHYVANYQNAQYALVLLTAQNVDYNIRNNVGLSPVHVCAGKGPGEDIEALLYVLLNNGFDVNIQADMNGYTPLHCAVEAGLVNITKLLIFMSADLTLEDKMRGITPLDMAVSLKRKALIDLLGVKVQCTFQKCKKSFIYSRELIATKCQGCGSAIEVNSTPLDYTPPAVEQGELQTRQAPEEFDDVPIDDEIAEESPAVDDIAEI